MDDNNNDAKLAVALMALRLEPRDINVKWSQSILPLYFRISIMNIT